MKLTRKIILLVGAVCILFSLLYFLLYRSVLAHPVEERKIVRARKITGSARTALENESKRIRTLTEDWAMWDTMYHFTSNPTQAVLDDLNPPVSLIDSDLSFLAILNKNKEILYANGHDHVNNKPIPFSQFKSGRGKIFTFVDATFNDTGTKCGLVLSEHGFLLLESAQVLKSNDEGPPNGRLIMGRIIDKSFENKIGRILGEKVTIITDTTDSEKLPTNTGHSHPFSFKQENRNFIIDYPFLDYWNKPLFSLRIVANMEAFYMLEKAARLFFILLILGFALLGILVYFIIHRLVVRRVSDISNKTGEIITFDDLTRRIPEHYSDEITRLCENINKMLLRLQEENRKREEIERTMVLNEKLVFLGTVTSKIAHEVNNPLFAIENAFRHMVNRLPKDDERLNRVVSLMDKELRRVRDITRDMNQYSVHQIDSFRQSSLETVVANAIDVVTWSKLLKSVTIHFPDRDRPFPMYCNPGTLQQVFMNLFVNSVQAIGDHGDGQGDIYIHIHNDGEAYRVEISDNGPGISDEIKPVVFAPFQTTKPGKGSGLGLYICQTIINDHGGTIEIDNTRTKGAGFIIRLPKDNQTPGPKKGGNGNGAKS